MWEHIDAAFLPNQTSEHARNDHESPLTFSIVPHMPLPCQEALDTRIQLALESNEGKYIPQTGNIAEVELINRDDIFS